MADIRFFIAILKITFQMGLIGFKRIYSILRWV